VQTRLRGADQPADLPEGRSTPLVVAVIGAGYVGLVTSACLSSLNHMVRCVDIDPTRVESLRAGRVPFSEPGLPSLIQDGVNDGRLTFGVDAVEAARGADIVFIAVGTLDGAGRWTDRHVRAVLETLLRGPEVPPLLVVRSTLRPGRMSELHELVVASGHSTTLLLNPEFTKEGSAVADFLAPDRIVIGVPAGSTAEVADPLLELYRGIDVPVVIADHASAELIKIGANAFLATKITFANELARFCREVGGDMAAVRRGIGLDPRIGPDFLRTGPGFGGSCLPSQVDLLAAMSDELGLDAQLLPAVGRSNRAQAARIAREILATPPAPQRVAILGLAFKAGTDDLRESPAIRLLEELHARGVRDMRAHDPAIDALPSHPSVEVSRDPYTAARAADILVVATEWPQFHRLDWVRLAGLVAHREVYDTRGVVDVDAATAAGFRVRSLERGPRAGGAGERSAARNVA
jgi:UDPglucose 6-dehydrogenase